MLKLVDYLFKDLSVQFAVLPEFISFLKGRKKIIRIVIEKLDKPLNSRLFEELGYSVSVARVYSIYKDNSFALLVPGNSGLCKGEYEVVSMISISSSAKDLSIFENAELDGETERAGRMLGYPRCCTRNVEKISVYEGMWGNYYLEDFQKNKLASQFGNRFPIAWGGLSPVGELFPCSLRCPHAIRYSQNMMADLIEFGFNRLAAKTLDHARTPVYIHMGSGAISTGRKDGYSKIVFGV